MWLIGGRDPTGGAGVDRDLATLRAFAPELDAVVVVTADTQQGDGRPARAFARDPAELARDLAALPPPIGVKLGLVPAPLVQTVIDALKPLGVAAVLDPVLYASEGGALGSSAKGLRHLAREIATLVTPNRMEALALCVTCTSTVDVDTLVEQLAIDCSPAAVLIKGGHYVDPAFVTDRLWWRGSIRSYRRPRLPGPDPRGTGCALATAIACELARGSEITLACETAIAWLDDARTRTVPGPDGRPHLAF